MGGPIRGVMVTAPVTVSTASSKWPCSPRNAGRSPERSWMLTLTRSVHHELVQVAAVASRMAGRPRRMTGHQSPERVTVEEASGVPRPPGGPNPTRGTTWT